MRKLFSFNSELTKVTGVQKVLLDIHHAVKDTYEAKIVGTVPYEKVNKNHDINKTEYIQFKNPLMFYNSIVIIHERKFLLMFWLLNHLLFQNIKLVYIHHNVFYSHRILSIMPDVVVAISDEGVENLKNYFHVPIKHIHKIYNCVVDIHPSSRTFENKQTITILYPARINKVKRQVEVVRHLKGKLNKKIHILFAGEGPCYQELITEIGNDPQFTSLGFRNDITNLLQKCDYMMLFSSQEGLPITLIEATMCGTPIICNNVGGNCEIARSRQNAFIANDWNELAFLLNNLTEIKPESYLDLSINSRRIYEKNFTFEKFKANYLTLLSTLS